MSVNLPLSFDHGWWECGDKAAERWRGGEGQRGKDRWEAGTGGRGGAGKENRRLCVRERERERGSCYIDFCKRERITKIHFHVQKINIDWFFGFGKLSTVTNGKQEPK